MAEVQGPKWKIVIPKDTNGAVLKSCSLSLPFRAEKAYSTGKTAAIRYDHGPLLLPTIPLVDWLTVRGKLSGSIKGRAEQRHWREKKINPETRGGTEEKKAEHKPRKIHRELSLRLPSSLQTFLHKKKHPKQTHSRPISSS